MVKICISLIGKYEQLCIKKDKHLGGAIPPSLTASVVHGHCYLMVMFIEQGTNDYEMLSVEEVERRRKEAEEKKKVKTEKVTKRAEKKVLHSGTDFCFSRKSYSCKSNSKLNKNVFEAFGSSTNHDHYHQGAKSEEIQPHNKI